MKPGRPKRIREGAGRARAGRGAPHARLVGGDRLQGGPHVGPGHAGRRSLWRRALAAATAAALVVGQLLGGWRAAGGGIALAQSPASGNANIAYLHNPNGGAYISVDELAEKAGLINYEVLCSLSRRVPRVYIKNGSVFETTDYML